MLSRQDKRHVVLIYTLGFVIFLIACISIYKIIYEPARSELLALHRQLSAQTPANVAGVNIGFGEYAVWQNAVSDSQKQVYQKLMSMIGKASLQVQEIRFDEKQAATPFYELPVSVKISGNFTNLMHFFIALANAHMVFSFEQLALAKTESSIQAVLQLRFRVLQ